MIHNCYLTKLCSQLINELMKPGKRANLPAVKQLQSLIADGFTQKAHQVTGWQG